MAVPSDTHLQCHRPVSLLKLIILMFLSCLCFLYIIFFNHFFIVGRKEFSVRFFCRFLILRNIISPSFTGTHKSMCIKSQIHNEFAGFIGFFQILEQLKNYSSLCCCASFFFVNQQKPFWAWCLADLYRCEKDLICEYKSDGFSSRKALNLLAWFTLLLIIFLICFFKRKCLDKNNLLCRRVWKHSSVEEDASHVF